MGRDGADDKGTGGQGGDMRVGGDWLENANTQRVMRALEDAGYQAYAVGGCVRNALLDAPIADVDIATDALPEQVQALAKSAGLRSVPTGIDHGTITVISKGEPFEVTTFRRDVSTDGRRATVEFSRDMKDDALRRDFTVNALYVARDGTLVDPLGGLPDIRARRIRFIEDADKRIEEDYLRILRFFRFYAWYGDPDQGPDPEGLAACGAHVDGIARLSKERLGAEMKKLLAAPDPAPSVGAMAACGALAQVLAGADAQYLAPLVHLEQAHGFVPRWQRRLVALGGENLSKALRLSKAEDRYLKAVRAAMEAGKGPAATAYMFGKDQAIDAKLVESAMFGQDLPANFLPEVERGASAEFPVKAADLMERLGTGPQLGLELVRLETLWIDADFRIGKDDLLHA